MGNPSLEAVMPQHNTAQLQWERLPALSSAQDHSKESSRGHFEGSVSLQRVRCGPIRHLRRAEACLGKTALPRDRCCHSADAWPPGLRAQSYPKPSRTTWIHPSRASGCTFPIHSSCPKLPPPCSIRLLEVHDPPRCVGF